MDRDVLAILSALLFLALAIYFDATMRAFPAADASAWLGFLGNTLGGVIGALGAAVAVYFTINGQLTLDRKIRAEVRQQEAAELIDLLKIEIFQASVMCWGHTAWWQENQQQKVPIWIARQSTGGRLIAFPANINRINILPSNLASKLLAFHGAIEALAGRAAIWASLPPDHSPSDDEKADVLSDMRSACMFSVACLTLLDLGDRTVDVPTIKGVQRQNLRNLLITLSQKKFRADFLTVEMS